MKIIILLLAMTQLTQAGPNRLTFGMSKSDVLAHLKAHGVSAPYEITTFLYSNGVRVNIVGTSWKIKSTSLCGSSGYCSFGFAEGGYLGWQDSVNPSHLDLLSDWNG